VRQSLQLEITFDAGLPEAEPGRQKMTNPVSNHDMKVRSYRDKRMSYRGTD
jgi:hypothetical protein